MSVFRDEKIWRRLTNFWTLVVMAFLIADFYLYGAYDFLIAPLSVIYIGVLGLYAGTKEFDRWYELHGLRRHPGEWFIFVWTLVIFGLIAFSFLIKDGRKVPPEAIATYIMVLSVFALTQQSKALYHRKKEMLAAKRKK